jgi:site-specific DNA-adenine methylase
MVVKRIGMTKAHPFIKWVGGKTQLLPELHSHMPFTFKARLIMDGNQNKIVWNAFWEVFCASRRD